MDFIRLDTIDYGPVYVRPEHIAAIRKIDDTKAKVSIVIPHANGIDLEIASDPDEIALSLERAVPGCRTYRIN